jgi:hypothetical protein
MSKLDSNYANMQPADLRVLLKQKDSKISFLELRLKKAEHLLKTVIDGKSLKKRITPALPKSFKLNRAGGNAETN